MRTGFPGVHTPVAGTLVVGADRRPRRTATNPVGRTDARTHRSSTPQPALTRPATPRAATPAVKRPCPPGSDTATYDRDAYVEVLIATTWEKLGAEAAARIVERLDEPFLQPGEDACAEVERRLAALIGYCRDEVLPRVERLERGLAGIEVAGADPAHADWRARAVAFWPALRVAIDRDHRAVWLKVHRLRRLLDRLDPAARAAIGARHGALLAPDERATDALRALWPGDRLRALDARAAALGLALPRRPRAPRARRPAA